MKNATQIRFILETQTPPKDSLDNFGILKEFHLASLIDLKLAETVRLRYFERKTVVHHRCYINTKS